MHWPTGDVRQPSYSSPDGNAPAELLTRSVEDIHPGVYQGLQQELDNVSMVDATNSHTMESRSDYLDPSYLRPALVVTPPERIPTEPSLILTGSSPATGIPLSTQQFQEFVSTLPPRQDPRQEQSYYFQPGLSVAQGSSQQHDTVHQQPDCIWNHPYNPSYCPGTTSRGTSEVSISRHSNTSANKKHDPQQCPECPKVLSNKDGL
jgi:hypothetical protein